MNRRGWIRQNIVEPATDALVFQNGEHMTIAVQSCLGRSVTNLILYELQWGLALIDQQADVGVPEVMKAHPAYFGTGQGWHKKMDVPV